MAAAMEGSIAPVQCVENDHTCESRNVCGTQDLWNRVDAALREVLGGTSLADLILEAQKWQHVRPIQLPV